MKVNDDLDTTELARVLSQLSGDLVLVMDSQGLILSVATGQDTPAVAGVQAWEGRRRRATRWARCCARRRRPAARDGGS